MNAAFPVDPIEVMSIRVTAMSEDQRLEFIPNQAATLVFSIRINQDTEQFFEGIVEDSGSNPANISCLARKPRACNARRIEDWHGCPYITGPDSIQWGQLSGYVRPGQPCIYFHKDAPGDLRGPQFCAWSGNTAKEQSLPVCRRDLTNGCFIYVMDNIFGERVKNTVFAAQDTV